MRQSIKKVVKELERIRDKEVGSLIDKAYDADDWDRSDKLEDEWSNINFIIDEIRDDLK